MKLLGCGYISSTVVDALGGVAKNEALELVPDLERGYAIFPVWGGVYVKNKSVMLSLGSATSARSSEIVRTGDNTIVYNDTTVSWDGSASSHTTLGGSATTSAEEGGSFAQRCVAAVSRRAVWVGSGGEIREIEPHKPPVEYKLDYPLPLKVTALALGAQFTLALGHCGIIWSWGINNHGQLGQGHIETVKEPTPVDCLGGLQIRDIAAGYWHSLAVTEFDVVYAWGWNNKGQLALPAARSMESEPVALFDEDTEITKVSCGRSHSAFLESGGNLHVTGYNKYGQCDPGNDCEELSLNNTLSDCAPLATEVSDVVCGPWSTFYVAE